MSKSKSGFPEYKRKAMRLGQSTVIVSLPKDWVTSMGVKPGTPLRIIVEEDGSLKVVPGEGGEEYAEKLKICTIDTAKFNRPEMLESIIVGAYVVGWPSVKIISTLGPISRDNQKTIFNTINMLEGAIISDQSEDSILIQFITDLTNLNFYSVLKRMFTMLISMIDRISYEIENETYDFSELETIENAIDKSYRMALRQIILAQKIPRILENIGVDSRLHLLGNRAIIKAVEECSDALHETFKRIEVEGIKTALKPKKVKDELLQVLKDTAKLLSQMYSAIDTMDEVKSFNIIEERSVILDRISMLRAKIVQEIGNVKAAISLWELLNSLEKVVDQVKGISEIIINRAIEECEKRWT